MWLLHPFWSFLRTPTPNTSSSINPLPSGREVLICIPSLLWIHHGHQPHPFREEGFDLHSQPPLDTPRPKYNTQLQGGTTSVSMEGESKADGQRVSIWPSAQGSGSWMDANSRHHRGNGLAFLPLLAIPGLCPSDRPPLQTQGPSAPSIPFWCICP